RRCTRPRDRLAPGGTRHSALPRLEGADGRRAAAGTAEDPAREARQAPVGRDHSGTKVKPRSPTSWLAPAAGARPRDNPRLARVRSAPAGGTSGPLWVQP